MGKSDPPADILKIIDSHSSDWLIYRAASGEILYSSSSAAKEITGYGREDFLSQSDFFFQIIHPDDRNRIIHEFNASLKNPSPGAQVFRIVHKNGEARWISHRCSPVFDEAGNVIGRVSSNLDITKEKRAEMELLENESRFKTILNVLPDIIFVLDDKSRFVDCYPPKSPLLLRPCDEVIGSSARDILPEFLANLAEKKVKETLESGHIQVFEYNLEVSGEIKWFEARMVPKGKRQVLTIIRDITKQKRAEAALRESEEKYRQAAKLYRLMADNIPDLVWAKDLECRYIFTNRAICEKLLNASDTDEPIGKTDLFFANRERHRHPERKDWHTFGEICVNSDEIVLNTQKARRFDEYGNVKGQFLYLDVFKAPIFDETGKIIGTVGHGRIVTKEKEVEKRVAESEKRYRQLFENSPDPIFINSLDGRILDMNPAALKLFRLSSLEETKSIKVADLYQNPEERPEFIEILKKKGSVKDYELNLKTLDGSDMVVLLTATLITDEKNHPFAIEGILRDITQQKAQERYLIQLATVIEQASQSILITDMEGNIVYANPAFEKTTGYALREVRGKNPRILQSGHHDKSFYRNLWHTLTSGKTWFGTFLNKRKDGTLYYEKAAIFPIKDAKGNIINFAAVKQDITGEKKLETRLIQVQKMETVGQLAGGIAHDFNNLLNIIKGYCELGLSRIPQNAPGFRELSTIQEVEIRAETLVNQLLAFSRKQTVEPRVIDINRVVTELGKMLRRIISENIQFETSLTPDLPFIKADPSQIEQVIMNLVVNARDAIAAKRDKTSAGKILLETSHVTLDKAYVGTHLEVKPGDYILISVSDTGIGMDEETRQRVFEPFFTTKETKKGTGLGLSTVYGIVKQNLGYINVYSEPGRGTTFKIYWPATHLKATDEVDSHSMEISRQGKGLILFVEDETQLRELAAGALRARGYKVMEAANGLEALNLLKCSDKSFNLIITDVIMPVMNGDELARQAAEICPDIKILFTSGYTNNHILNHGAIKEGIHFLAKPYSLTDLISKIQENL